MLLGGNDAFDLQAGEHGAAADAGVGAALGLEAQAADFFAHAGAFSFGDNLGAFNYRFADHVILPVREEQDAIQFNGGSVFHVQMINIEGLTLGYLILLAAGFNYSVNGAPPDKNNLPLYQSASGRARAGKLSLSRC